MRSALIFTPSASSMAYASPEQTLASVGVVGAVTLPMLSAGAAAGGLVGMLLESNELEPGESLQFKYAWQGVAAGAALFGLAAILGSSTLLAGAHYAKKQELV